MKYMDPKVPERGPCICVLNDLRQRPFVHLRRRHLAVNSGYRSGFCTMFRRFLVDWLHCDCIEQGSISLFDEFYKIGSNSVFRLVSSVLSR